MLIKGVLVATSIIILTGCSKNNNDTGVEESSAASSTNSLSSKELDVKDYIKCSVAAASLEDSILQYAIDSKATRDKVKFPSAADTMQISGDFRNELEPDGSLSDPEFALEKADKWRKSKTCQIFIKEYYAHLNSASNTYGKSLIVDANSGGTQSTCASFNEQYEFAKLPMPAEIKSKFDIGLEATLKDVYKSIKPHQAQYFIKDGSGAFALSEYCSANPSSNLTNAMQQVAGSTAIESPRTMRINNIIKETDSDDKYSGCANGEANKLEQKICINLLYNQALQNAYSESKSCDIDMNDSKCIDNPDQFIQQFMRPLVLNKLNEIKAKIELVIASPSSDYHNVNEIEDLSRSCNQRLIKQKITGEEYAKKSKEICLKEGEKLFLEPYRQQLAEVNAEIKKYS